MVFVTMYTIATAFTQRTVRLDLSADRDGWRLDGSRIDYQMQRAQRRFIAW
jgi:hypothetical protein